MESLKNALQKLTLRDRDEEKPRDDDGVEEPVREEPPSEDELDPGLFYAIAAREWPEAERILTLNKGLKFRKVSGAATLLLLD
jgi:hypothetical protein